MATNDELRKMTPQELDRMTAEQRDGLFNMAIKRRTGHLENTAQIGKSRRELARLLTIQREQQLGLKRATKQAPKTKSRSPGAEE